MAICSTIPIKQRKLCIGDMRHNIDIASRVQTTGAIDYGEDFTIILSTRAAINTSESNGRVFFDGTNTSPLTTHSFYIRVPNIEITEENWIIFKNENYNIQKVINLDERNLFLRIDCNVRGNESIPINLR